MWELAADYCANDVYAILSPKTEDDKVDMDEVDGIRYFSKDGSQHKNTRDMRKNDR